jgi:hypothetical protein
MRAWILILLSASIAAVESDRSGEVPRSEYDVAQRAAEERDLGPAFKELDRHLERMADLDRIIVVAEEGRHSALVERARRARQIELDRHRRAVDRITDEERHFAKERGERAKQGAKHDDQAKQ